MKKFLIAGVAAIIAATSFATVAEAGHRGWKWRNHGNHHGWNHRGWRGNHFAYRGYYGRHHGRRYGGYWGPGVVVIAPGYYGGYDDYYYEGGPDQESGR